MTVVVLGLGQQIGVLVIGFDWHITFAYIPKFNGFVVTAQEIVLFVGVIVNVCDHISSLNYKFLAKLLCCYLLDFLSQTTIFLESIV